MGDLLGKPLAEYNNPDVAGFIAQKEGKIGTAGGAKRS